MSTKTSPWKRPLFSVIFGALWAILLLTTAHAQGSLNGVINVKITLTDSCTINGTIPTAGATFGTLDYGTQPTLFTTATAQTIGTSGPITIQCSALTAPTLKLVSGAHDPNATAPHLHSMANGAGQYASYDIYSDAGETAVIPNNAVFFTSANNNLPENVLIYGKAFGNGALVPGVYTDVLTILFTF